MRPLGSVDAGRMSILRVFVCDDVNTVKLRWWFVCGGYDVAPSSGHHTLYQLLRQQLAFIISLNPASRKWHEIIELRLLEFVAKQGAE